MIRKMVTISSLAMALAISVPQLAAAHGGFGGGFSGGHFGGGLSAGAHFSGAHIGGSFGDHFTGAHVGVGHFYGDHFARGHFGGRHFAFRRHGHDFFFFDGPYDEGYYDGYGYDDDACYEQVQTRRGLRWIWICD